MEKHADCRCVKEGADGENKRMRWRMEEWRERLVFALPTVVQASHYHVPPC